MMALIEIQGDLLKSDCHVIAHGSNCFCNMGSGIARQIAKDFPEAAEADFFTIRGDETKLGTFTVAECMPSGKRVYNLYTQYKYGIDRQHLDYDALRRALYAMRTDLEELGLYESVKVGFPLIGCGLAGGDWSIVKAQIDAVFSDRDVHIYYFNDGAVEAAKAARDRLRSAE